MSKGSMAGWSKEAKQAAKRIAAKCGRTAEAVAKSDLRQHRLLSGRGALYRANIID